MFLSPEISARGTRGTWSQPAVLKHRLPTNDAQGGGTP